MAEMTVFVLSCEGFRMVYHISVNCLYGVADTVTDGIEHFLYTELGCFGEFLVIVRSP